MKNNLLLTEWNEFMVNRCNECERIQKDHIFELIFIGPNSHSGCPQKYSLLLYYAYSRGPTFNKIEAIQYDYDETEIKLWDNGKKMKSKTALSKVSSFQNILSIQELVYTVKEMPPTWGYYPILSAVRIPPEFESHLAIDLL